MSAPQNPYQPPAHGTQPDPWGPNTVPDPWGPNNAPGPHPHAHHWGPTPPQWREEDVQAEMKRLNNQSFIFGVPGLILQGLSNTTIVGEYTGLLALPGLVLLLIGLSFYARSRGRSPWFAALGFLSFLGLIILAVLPRRCLVCGGPKGSHGRCQHCQAPMVMR